MTAALICATVLGLAFVVRDVVLRVRASTVATLDQERLGRLEKQAAEHEERIHSLEYKQPLGRR